jgi:O-antigen/teichoic acid export membrane protein
MRSSLLLHKLTHGRSFHADASVTAAANIAIAGMGFCTGILAARMLGPNGRGQLAAIQTTPSVIATFAMIGMPEALVYFSARETSEAGRYLGTAVTLSLVSSLPAMILAYFAMPLLVHAQGSSIVYYARLYLLIAPLYATAGMLLHPLRGTSEFRAWNVLRTAVPVLALAVLAIAYETQRQTSAFIAFGNLTTYAILLVPGAWMVRGRIRTPYTPDAAKTVPMLRYGFPCMMSGLPQMLNLRLDQMLMAAFLPAHALGLYVVAVSWSGAVLPLLTSIGATLLPSIASTNDKLGASLLMCVGVRMTTLLSVIICGILVITTPFALPLLFGDRYRGSIKAALILIPAGGLLGVNFSLQEGIRGLGQPYAVLRAETFGLAVTAIALTVMLRPLGIIGAAAASILGYLAVTFLLLASATRITGTSVLSLIVPSLEEIQHGVKRIIAATKEEAA